MSDKFHLTHENFVAIARDMMLITNSILKDVVAKTEQAATEIGNKIESVSSLSSDQAKTVKGLISAIYEEGTKEHAEVQDLASEANDMADKIFESAQSGDISKANELGDSEQYSNLKKKTSSISKQLEKIAESDKELLNTIAPVIMALQFQDSIRQSLENLIRCFEDIFAASTSISQAKLPAAFAGTFWTRLENRFTTTAERNTVRKVVWGENAKLIEDAKIDDPFLF